MTKHPIEFGWHLPTSGDGKYAGVKPEREGTLDYLTEVAQAAETAGFEFVLIPTGGPCTDAWIAGAAIAARTSTLKPLVAMRPGLIAPVLAARMGASLDYLSGGRALINIVTGGNPDDLKATGDPLYDDHDGRYARTLEFVDIVKKVWTGGDEAGVQAKGRYYEIEGGRSQPAPIQRPHPPIYFGGSSASARRVAAQIADVYLMWAEPVDMIKEQIAGMEAQLGQLEEQTGVRRTLRYGLRAQLVVRPTEEEAWRAAWDIISLAEGNTQAKESSLATQSRLDARNQQRQTDLWRQSEADDYVIGPNLWAGISRYRTGGSVAIVGTPEQVADRIAEYVEVGISSFIFSGYPHLEEAQIAGRLLMPLLKAKTAERQIGAL
ncbi:LLM class flavin-dependent oxidoreductase [Paenibacillus filicis]|uniref:LLM class flavin-dependent oxidoreductase n=1 Tax=Paenibacillus filicis TaxID=669464 RepID=A0ABU9DFA6_9BACL